MYEEKAEPAARELASRSFERAAKRESGGDFFDRFDSTSDFDDDDEEKAGNSKLAPAPRRPARRSHARDSRLSVASVDTDRDSDRSSDADVPPAVKPQQPRESTHSGRTSPASSRESAAPAPRSTSGTRGSRRPRRRFEAGAAPMSASMSDRIEAFQALLRSASAAGKGKKS